MIEVQFTRKHWSVFWLNPGCSLTWAVISKFIVDKVDASGTRVHWAVPLIATGVGSGGRFRGDTCYGLVWT